MIHMSEILEKFQEKHDSVYKYRKIAAILAAATLITESPNIIDRMSNALTSEQAIRALSDALRIIESIKSSSSKIKLQETNNDIKIITDEEQSKIITIPYGLPNESDVVIFIDNVSENISIARKIGTLASALVVKELRGEK